MLSGLSYVGHAGLRFSIAHIFLAISITAFALFLRSCWISLQSDAFTFVATVLFSVTCASYAGWLQFRLMPIALIACVSAVLLSATFSLERVFHSPDALFPRDHITEMYFDDVRMNIMAVLMHSGIAAIIGTGGGFLLSRFRNWLCRNAVNLLIAIATSVVCGYAGNTIGSMVFPHVPPAQLSFFSTVLGLILGIAWVASYRGFSVGPLWETDAG